MSWMNKMERKFGKYAIHNITLYLIICYAFGYVIQMVNGDFLAYLTLNPYEILHGQVWRLLTWLVIPPDNLNLFTLIMLYFYYSIGTSLERTWGTFRYNVYLISGMLFTIIGAFLFLLITVFTGNTVISAETATVFYYAISLYFSTYYVCMSIILAFAATFPDVQILFMFIIPIKIKVLGIIYGIILGYEFIMDIVTAVRSAGTINMFIAVAQCIAILFSMLNFIIFFVTSRKSFRTPKQIKRQREFHNQTVKIRKVTKHKCAICGRTEDDNPDMEFRFCSKCDGNYEYCQEHLFTHTHIKSNK